jgi:hypothetical protein
MAKYICCKSGLEIESSYFSIHMDQSMGMHHPIFNIPLKKLYRYFPKWQNGELNNVDSYLYFLSLLDSTELVEFRIPASYHEKTDSIIASNMESLFFSIGRIVTIRHPKFSIPKFAITKDTASLSNIQYWIKDIEEAYDSFCNGLRDQELRSKLQRKESALERLIKNPALKPERYAHILADWAVDAAAFPSFSFTDPNGNETTIDAYWKQIILLCYQKESLLSIPESDIRELLEHCEENLELGSIQSYHLFNTIREGLQTIQGFYGTGPTAFQILDSESSNSLHDAQLKLMIDSAPTSKPLRTAYATEFAFLKAMMKYKLSMKQNSESSSSSSSNISESL